MSVDLETEVRARGSGMDPKLQIRKNVRWLQNGDVRP